VGQLPDFKSSFPHWDPTPMTKVFSDLEPAGRDLIQVYLNLPAITAVYTWPTNLCKKSSQP
jgi:hypothetical protein